MNYYEICSADNLKTSRIVRNPGAVSLHGMKLKILMVIGLLFCLCQMPVAGNESQKFYLNYHGQNLEISQINDVEFLERARTEAEANKFSYARMNDAMRLYQSGRQQEAINMATAPIMKVIAIENRIHWLRLMATAVELYKHGKKYSWNIDEIKYQMNQQYNADDIYLITVAAGKMGLAWTLGVAMPLQGKTRDAAQNEFNEHMNQVVKAAQTRIAQLPNAGARWNVRMKDLYHDLTNYNMMGTPEQRAAMRGQMDEMRRRNDMMWNNMMMSMMQSNRTSFDLSTPSPRQQKKFQSVGYCDLHQCSYVRGPGMAGGCPKCSAPQFGLKTYPTCPKCHRTYDATFGHHCR